MEEFYTVRCQVADMKNLYESLDEVTVKDTLDGDNMYTCDKCGKKVRAEKRACFKNLPRIICFNTMRCEVIAIIQTTVEGGEMLDSSMLGGTMLDNVT